ncbi:MAG TPA: ectonucleotide pyrophosphatase/phosphodiesterase [Vicinamibacterales bacterium]|nr:ectonucleotide pyrophosphatase/phosphodiesterase [Vicinamibacterales bacterium]
MISLDGFRWDYLEKTSAPALRALASRGVRAEALIPSFPTKTFPNHYTIVTGLYPGHHGIVANNILDAGTGRAFSMSNRTETRDPMWWGGEPIWVTAGRAGRMVATMFWPGSETAIGGVMPAYWRPYDEDLSGAARVDQVLRWLDLPASRRPAMLTLYFEDVDSAGHDSGPDSEGVRQAIRRVDGYVGRLMRGLKSRRLDDLANIIVVSDHGMAAVLPGRVLTLSDYVPLADVDVADINPTLGLFPKAGKGDSVYRALAAASPFLHVYRREETPAAWHYRDHKRIPPIVGVVDEGWQIVSGTIKDKAEQLLRPPRGAHGYDPSVVSMRGILIAAGPAFKEGATVPAVENVHVYDLLAAVLKITAAPNDGDTGLRRQFLR